jgi:hypothetical protein
MSIGTGLRIVAAILTGVLYAPLESPGASSVGWEPFRDGAAPTAAAVQPAQFEAPPEWIELDQTASLPSGEIPCQVGDMTYCLTGVPACGVPADDPSMWRWRLLPEGVIWQSYWASVHEPRISGIWFGGGEDGLLDVTLGGRGSLLRYGAGGPGRPSGAELQIEGAAFPRLNLAHNWDLDAVDFRFGLPLVYGRDKWQTKFSYYHLSSHMGDELAIRENALAQRINYSRDVLVWGLSYFPRPAWRLYGETGWAFHYDGGSDPWEFQFGVDVARPGPTGALGTPFAAFNGHLRQELNYGGNFVAQAGWLWRGETAHVFRTGVHYFNGKSNQYEFFNQFEQQIGGGVWYDF